MTQPSVSAAVNALERELGVRLTERAGRTVRPTAAGAAYAPFAADVLGLLEQGRRAAREAAEAHPHTLRISAVTTAGEYLVPQLIQAFRERRPEVEISLDVGNRELVFQRVLDHKVDVAVTGRIPDDDRLVGVDFADNEFVLITSADDPLARRRWVGIEELATRPWLLREPGSGTRTLVEEFLASRGIEPNVLTLGSNGAIKQAARTGLGIAIQSRGGGGARARARPARHNHSTRRPARAPLARGAQRDRPRARGRGGLHGVLHLTRGPARPRRLAG